MSDKSIAGWACVPRGTPLVRFALLAPFFLLVITSEWGLYPRDAASNDRGGGENSALGIVLLATHTPLPHTPQPTPPATPPPPSKEYCDHAIDWDCDYGNDVADICQDQCPEVACADLVRRQSRTLPRSLARLDHTH